MKKMFSLFIVVVLVCSSIDGLVYRPVVLMHGLLAKASDMDELAGWIRQVFEGIYVVSIEIGNGIDDSLFLSIDKQIDLFCRTVVSDVN